MSEETRSRQRTEKARARTRSASPQERQAGQKKAAAPERQKRPVRRKKARPSGFTLVQLCKWGMAVVLAVFIFRQVAGNPESSTDFSVMQSAVTAAADLTPMQEGDNQMLRRLYGLDPQSYAGVMLYYPTTNMGADEILLVKLQDISQQDTVASAIENRVSTQLNAFQGYGAEQTAMLEKSVTEVRGNYILFVSAADPAPVRQAFLDNL